MRHEFEKWYQEEVTGCNGEWLVKDDGGQYVERSTREAWIVWQQATGGAVGTALLPHKTYSRHSSVQQKH